MIDTFLTLTSQRNDIKLLKNKNVIQWLMGDLTFLPTHDCNNSYEKKLKTKESEDKWGKSIMLELYPEKIKVKQWTNSIGEALCSELFKLQNKDATKAKPKGGYQPDFEIEDCVIEVKTGTYFTTGTASEKILGCPFKYIDVPDLWNKPLVILCVGGAEKICRESYGILSGGKQQTEGRKNVLDFYKSRRIEYMGATDILKKLLE